MLADVASVSTRADGRKLERNRTHENVTRVNKIEATYEVLRVKKFKLIVAFHSLPLFQSLRTYILRAYAREIGATVEIHTLRQNIGVM